MLPSLSHGASGGADTNLDKTIIVDERSWASSANRSKGDHSSLNLTNFGSSCTGACCQPRGGLTYIAPCTANQVPQRVSRMSFKADS